MRFLLLELILADLPGQDMAISPFLLLELLLADQLADLPPPLVEASSGQEWQYEISTVSAHIGRSPGQEWQFHICTSRAPIGRSPGRSIAHW